MYDAAEGQEAGGDLLRVEADRRLRQKQRRKNREMRREEMI